MMGIFDLPVELRGLIIDAVLDQQSTATSANPAVYPEGVYDRNTSYGESYATDAVTYRTDVAAYTPNCCILFAVGNRQLAVETVDRVAIRRRCVPVKYGLDIIVAHERTLLPTWTHMPVLGEHIHTLTVNIRLTGEPLPRPKPWNRREALNQIDGHPPPLLWGFYKILARFLDLGPMPPGSIAAPRRLMSIRFLDIDVECPRKIPEGMTLYPADMWLWDLVDHNYAQAAAADGSKLVAVVHPEALLVSLCFLITGLLSMGIDWARYGKLLYERIGIIRLRLGGTVRNEWDLAGRLAELSSTEDFRRRAGLSPSSLLKPQSGWQQSTWDLRQRLDLPVLWDSDVRGGCRASRRGS